MFYKVYDANRPERKYNIEINYSKEDLCFITKVPELEAVIAHGETQEEAYLEILNAFSLYFSTRNEDVIPELISTSVPEIH